MPAEPRRGDPRISVITCAYNGDRYLAQAIESVLSQTWRDFEYILVDNASTDRTAQIIASYASADPRILVLHNPSGPNFSLGLNLTLDLARGDYVAILDADDLAEPERLARQVAFLDAHPEVGVLGTQAHTIDPEGKRIKTLNFPTDPGLAHWRILFQTPVLHSAAMMRRRLVDQAGRYSLPHWRMNDYELFTRLIRVTKITNLPEDLVAYRINPWQVSRLENKPQHAQVVLLIHALLRERLNLLVTLAEINRLYLALRAHPLPDEVALLRTTDLLGTVYERFMQVEVLSVVSRDLVRQECARRWMGMARVHHNEYPEASRAIQQRALALDPLLEEQIALE